MVILTNKSRTDNATVEAVALIVQIHLEQNRTDLALKEVLAAKKWAQDNLLINIAESWVGLRVVRALSNSNSKPQTTMLTL